MHLLAFQTPVEPPAVSGGSTNDESGRLPASGGTHPSLRSAPKSAALTRSVDAAEAGSGLERALVPRTIATTRARAIALQITHRTHYGRQRSCGYRQPGSSSAPSCPLEDDHSRVVAEVNSASKV